jgi:hypothetical protein
MSQYSLYHNYVHYTVPCSFIPVEDKDVIQLIRNIVKEHLHHIWKPEDRYVMMNDQGESIVYDNGHVYHMADSG